MPRGHTISAGVLAHKMGLDAATAKCNTLTAALSKARSLGHEHPAVPELKAEIMRLVAGLTEDVIGTITVTLEPDPEPEPAPKKGKKSE